MPKVSPKNESLKPICGFASVSIRFNDTLRPVQMPHMPHPTTWASPLPHSDCHSVTVLSMSRLLSPPLRLLLLRWIYGGGQAPTVATVTAAASPPAEVSGQAPARQKPLALARLSVSKAPGATAAVFRYWCTRRRRRRRKRKRRRRRRRRLRRRGRRRRRRRR